MWWMGWRNWCPAMRWMGCTLTITSTPPPTRPSTRPSLRPAARRTWTPGGGRTSPPWSRRPTTPSRPRTLPCGLGSAPRATPTTTSTSSTATYTAGWRPRARTPWWITCAPSSTGGMGIPCPAARSALPIPISGRVAGHAPGSATLYIGLGAYRIGDGDGGANPDSTGPVVHRAGSGPAGGRTACTGRGGLCPVPVWLAVRKQRLASARPGRMPGFAGGKQRRRGCLKGKSAV